MASKKKRKEKPPSLGIWVLDNGWKEERCYVVDPIDATTMDHLDFMRLHIGSDHIPVRPMKEQHVRICQLHEYAGVPYSGESVLYCSACKVNICIDCYRPFHKEKDLSVLRDKMINDYEKKEKKNDDFHEDLSRLDKKGKMNSIPLLLFDY